MSKSNIFMLYEIKYNWIFSILKKKMNITSKSVKYLKGQRDYQKSNNGFSFISKTNILNYKWLIDTSQKYHIYSFRVLLLL